MRRRSVPVACAWLALAATGCSLIFGVDGYEGQREAGLEAAVADAPDAGASDAVDAVDAGDAGDARGAAGADAGSQDGPADGGCTGFCDDFDDRSNPDLLGKWTNLMPPAGGIAEITGTQYKSPPHSAHFLAPMQSTGSNVGFLTVDQTLPPSGKFAVDFDFSLAYTASQYGVDDFSDTFEVGIGSLFGGALGFGNSGLATYGYFPFLADGGQGAQTLHNVGDVRSTPGNWRHFRLEETFDPAAGRVFLALDGVQSFVDTGVPTEPPSPPTGVQFSIGVSSTRQTSAVEIYVDNVHIQPMP
jgi:hypothetical protein